MLWSLLPRQLLIVWWTTCTSFGPFLCVLRLFQSQNSNHAVAVTPATEPMTIPAIAPPIKIPRPKRIGVGEGRVGGSFSSMIKMFTRAQVDIVLARAICT